jgi:homoserine dehydrogenase
LQSLQHPLSPSPVQSLGYAEADPTADVEGHDARNKLVLLARLAFGQSLRVGEVATRGIPVVTPQVSALELLA